MLGCDAAAKRGDAVDRAVGDGFGMIEKPVQPFERDIPVDLFEDIQRPRNGLVIGGVQTPGPAVFRQNPDNVFKLAFHFRRHVRPWLAEILEIGSGKDQHFACTIVPEVVVTLLVFDR
ncbi:hypothetical protein D3C86_1539080 [compost metagenome]